MHLPSGRIESAPQSASLAFSRERQANGADGCCSICNLKTAGSLHSISHTLLTEYVVSMPDVSVAFEDLVARLLDKNPATRIGWDELPQHPFWERPLPQAATPEQPLLEAFIADNDLAPQQGGAHSHEVTVC